MLTIYLFSEFFIVLLFFSRPSHAAGVDYIFYFNFTKPKATTKSPNEVIIEKEIVNEHNFDYVLNPKYEICKKLDNQPVYLLIYVHSAPENLKRRLSIRETWARRSVFRDIRLVFMMGYTTDLLLNYRLSLEYEIYKDIVQEDFIDAYRNLTYKGIMAMKWISQYCNNTKYILKVDDDVLTNLFLLLRHLNVMDRYNVVKPKTIMCSVWIDMIVQRDPNSKWFLSHNDFPNDLFGKYCSGSAYILTNDLPGQMYFISKYIKYFWIDDYFITGLVARALNTTYHFMNCLYSIVGTPESKFLDRRTKDGTVFGHFPGTSYKIFVLWNKIVESFTTNNPELVKGRSNFIRKNDFIKLDEFKWDRSIWDKYLNNQSDIDQNYQFNAETF